MTDWTEDEITALMAERDAAIARADAAEQMVAELRAMLTTGRDIVIETSTSTSSRHTRWVEDAYDTLQATEHLRSLVAAAPDLLEACERLLDGGWPHAEKDIELACSAIAKAKGATKGVTP